MALQCLSDTAGGVLVVNSQGLGAVRVVAHLTFTIPSTSTSSTTQYLFWCCSPYTAARLYLAFLGDCRFPCCLQVKYGRIWGIVHLDCAKIVGKRCYGEHLHQANTLPQMQVVGCVLPLCRYATILVQMLL